MFEKISKKGANILSENVIFIVLTIVFLTILFLFLASKTSNSALLEEKYAKQIALIIDSSKPGMIITLNMEDAVDKLKNKNLDEKIISITDNIVTVKLEGGKGYSYSFFNNVNVNAYPNKNKKEYVFAISEK